MEQLTEFIKALRAACDTYLVEEDAETEAAEAIKPARKVAAKAGPVSKAKAAKAVEPEEDEEEVDERLAELQAMRITQLRALAIKRGFNEAETKAEKDKTVLVEAIYNDEIANPDAEADAEEDDDEDEDDATDEGEQYTREDLQAMGLRELKALAKTSGIDASDMRGKDADSIIDMLLNEEDGDAEEDADDAEDEDEDGEEGYYSEADLKKMSLAELRRLAKEYEITVPRGTDQKGVVKLIMESAE